MHLDDGKVDIASHVSSDVLSNCKGQAATVSSHRSSVTGKNDCGSSWTSHGSCVPVRLLDRSFWMKHRCSGRQPARVREPVTHELPRRSMKYAPMTRVLAPPPDAKRPLRVTPCEGSVAVARRQKVSSPLAKRRKAKPATKTCPKFHRNLKGWRQLTPARTRRAMPAPVWEGIASPFSVILVYHASVRASGMEKNKILSRRIS